jgi:hypothetical protein
MLNPPIVLASDQVLYEAFHETIWSFQLGPQTRRDPITLLVARSMVGSPKTLPTHIHGITFVPEAQATIFSCGLYPFNAHGGVGLEPSHARLVLHVAKPSGSTVRSVRWAGDSEPFGVCWNNGKLYVAAVGRSAQLALFAVPLADLLLWADGLPEHQVPREPIHLMDLTEGGRVPITPVCLPFQGGVAVVDVFRHLILWYDGEQFQLESTSLGPAATTRRRWGGGWSRTRRGT